MDRLVRSFRVHQSAQTIAAYVADLANAADWQPFTVSSRAASPSSGTADADNNRNDSTHVGSHFEVIRRIAGRDFVMDYEVTTLQDDHVVISGRNRWLTSEDDVRFDVVGEHETEVTYGVAIRLRGRARYGEPMMRPVMARMADEATRNLQRAMQSKG